MDNDAGDNRLKLNEETRKILNQSLTSGTNGTVRDFGRHLTQLGMNDELRYPDSVSPKDREERVKRDGTAKTIVKKPPKDTWRKKPTVKTQDGDEIELTSDQLGIPFSEVIETFRRADELQREQGWSLVYFGTSGSDLEEEPSSGEELIYAKAVAGPNGVQNHDHVKEWEVDEDKTNETYGDPLTWTVKVQHGEEWSTHDVDASRAFKFSENNNVSILDVVWNYLLNLEKSVGGASEAYYRLAAQPFHFDFEQWPGEDKLNDINDTIQDFRSGLTDWFPTASADITEIGGEPADVTPAYEVNISLIAGATNIPKRILIGSERGELSSSQDTANYYGWIDERKARGEEQLFLPWFNWITNDLELIDQNVDPMTDWPPLFELNELEKAEVKKTEAEAYAAIIKATAPGQWESIVSREEVREALGLPAEMPTNQGGGQ